MSEIIKDLKDLVNKYEPDPITRTVRYVPICEHYKSGQYAQVCEAMGGTHISQGKTSINTKVLLWLRVTIEQQGDDISSCVTEALCL